MLFAFTVSNESGLAVPIPTLPPSFTYNPRFPESSDNRIPPLLLPDRVKSLLEVLILPRSLPPLYRDR